MEQPVDGPANSGTKRCWACPASTPYHQGFCGECWARLPLEVQMVYLSANTLPDPFAGLVRTAIAEGARQPARAPRKLSLGDLDL